MLFYDYGTADALADRLSVPEKLRETDGSGTILVQYARTGSGNVVLTDDQQPDLKLDLFGNVYSLSPASSAVRRRRAIRGRGTQGVPG